MAANATEALYLDPEEDEKNLGSIQGSLFWKPKQQVAGYRNMEKITATRKIEAGGSPFPMPYEKVDLGEVLIRREATELVPDTVELSVDDYCVKKNVAGLLVVKNGKVLYERYGLGNTENSRWISYSVAKSVVSMLIGAAISDGYIKDVDEKVTDYLPRLKGSHYEQATLRNLLQMSSGVRWNEDYADPKSDINSARPDPLAQYEHLRKLPTNSKPGEVFNYNTAETNLVGTLLRSAIGNNLSIYLSEKIWKPFGMETHAYWNLSSLGGGELGGCCINANLRDYARIGLFALGNGLLPNGKKVLPDNWMKESTTPSKGSKDYGYLWWLHGGGAYSARGIFGQGIYINPRENVVIALHSARAVARTEDDATLQRALFDGLSKSLED